MIPQLGAQEVAERLARGEPLVILDVREEPELERAALDGARWIPMSEISLRTDELDPEAETVVLCHHGIRSMRVACFLAEQGFTRLANLRGGIDAWSREVDAKVPIY